MHMSFFKWYKIMFEGKMKEEISAFSQIRKGDIPIFNEGAVRFMLWKAKRFLWEGLRCQLRMEYRYPQ